MNKKNDEMYNQTKSLVKHILINQKEYFEILSEFEDNETIHQIYESTLSEEATNHLMIIDSIYVLTLRKMANIINELRGKLQSSNNKVENCYDQRNKELEKELHETRMKLETISNIVNRGEKDA